MYELLLVEHDNMNDEHDLLRAFDGVIRSSALWARKHLLRKHRRGF